MTDVTQREPLATRDATAAATAARPLVHVVFSIDTMSVGGTEMNAVRTAERLDPGRFRVTVVTLRGEGPLAERYARAGIRVVRFPIYSVFGPKTIRQAGRLADFFRRERVEVLHCHDQYSNFFSVMSGRLARVPVIVASKRWLHSPLRYRVTNAIGYRLATRVLANSDAVAESLESVDRIARERVVVVPNFVDETVFDAPNADQLVAWRRELELADDAQVIGIIASLLPIKDHATLLRAVSRLAPQWPRLSLVIVGAGPSLDELRAQAAQLGVAERVRFAGLRPQTPSFHHLFDISVLCSVSEGFPNSLVEAMAASRPIVATAVGGVRDAVRDGDNGLLVPPRDDAALADAIGSLLADPSRARAMGAAGARRARSEFHAGVVIDSLELLYNDLLAKAR